MGAKQFFSKGGPTRFALWLSRYLPPWAGRALAALVARVMVMLNLDLCQAARANLRHVLGPDVTAATLNRKVYRLFFNAARGYYEFFHNVGRGNLDFTTFEPPIDFTPETKRYISEALASKRGLLILACHISNADLGGAALAQYMPAPVQVLTLANPSPGFEVFNQLREACGVQVTPLAPRALREAMARLREGGVVLTGPDRPIGAGDQPVTFFGAKACLPTGYIRIALRTDCLVMVLAVIEKDGAYWLTAHPPLEMKKTGDREKDTQVNLRRVLSQIEDVIRQHPEQWMMFLPVWKEGPCHD